ncbi:ArsC/Spx/MgsR family protein [Lentzea sp. HUAS12]|uniref:ArsC/Spx/MgsR family protein n=1 Tax=Lentzea sp. HUAS12 TaxID=2951806 RepID=UPI0020A17F76|nr:ArsC/Spx/MgsR family protein [Lentzea sp. HUAS12]USX49145.1 arsenate reductase family protein [Lentzea sp. HUAS12]
MEIWHNPRCSKSRAAKQRLDESNVEYTERRYLDDVPTPDELDHVLELLNKQPWEIARKKEAAYPATLEHDRAKWIEHMVANPSLIERPIIIDGDSARIER